MPGIITGGFGFGPGGIIGQGFGEGDSGEAGGSRPPLTLRLFHAGAGGAPLLVTIPADSALLTLSQGGVIVFGPAVVTVTPAGIDSAHVLSFSVPDYLAPGVYDLLWQWQEARDGRPTLSWERAVPGITIGALSPVAFESLTDLSIGGITRRQQHLYVHSCNLWRVDTPIGNNGKPGDSTPVLVYSGVRCFYEFTPNIDDPAIIARINRPNLFTTDVIHFLSAQEVRDQWWAVNTTRDEDGGENANYGQVHRILADPKNTPGTRRRRTNKQSVPATREQNPLALLIEGL